MSKSKEKLDLEFRHRRKSQVIGGVVSVTRDIVKWGAIAFIFYCGYLSVRDLSGKVTQADVSFKLFEGFAIHIMQSTELREWIEYALILVFFLWALFERKLRGLVIGRLTRRTHQLEVQLDPNRTSSRLTSTGQTRPGDEP
jgi:hypothetical protein